MLRQKLLVASLTLLSFSALLSADSVYVISFSLNTVHLTILIRLEQSIWQVRCRLRGRSG